MKYFVKTALCLLLTIAFFASDAMGCTTFCLKRGDEVLFGRNYDWMIGDGIVFVNRRGVAKSSLSLTGQKNPARWTSRYGSVTFNQYGRENPMGGMNETGLVVELMWLDEARYPKPDERPTLDVLEWVQYQLDTAATVQEVLQNAEKVRIESRVTLHYLVSDRSGNSAAIEFLDGKLVARAGENLPVATLANDTYEKSWEYAKKAEMQKAVTESSFDRFTRAASAVREFEKSGAKNSVEYAFNVLADVAQKGYTQWSIVYDQKNSIIYYRTLKNPTIKKIDVKAFDYSCGGAVKMLDMNAPAAVGAAAKGGEATGLFENYTSKANRDLIERSFGGTPFLNQTPAVMRDAVAKHAESFTCANGAGGGGVKEIRVEKPGKETFAATVESNYLTVLFPAYLAYQALFGE
jgi:penicillin V acylase-like amidase (Ntn superfamily)